MTGTEDNRRDGREGRSVQHTLAELGEVLAETIANIFRPSVARLSRRIARRMRFHAAGYLLSLLAVIWAAIGLTLAAAQHLPLWASYLCVSGVFAVGAAGAFIIPSLKNGTDESGRANNREGDNRHG